MNFGKSLVSFPFVTAVNVFATGRHSKFWVAPAGHQILLDVSATLYEAGAPAQIC